ncbi:MAG TPA: DUF885 domain-containing protein [Steroidobacteraceae bacterium]|nr:DUF885 domain-containing protein [Steroidobacteraceae bacterium]
MDSAFERLSARYFDEVLALSPVEATQLGEHRFDNRLDDLSPTGRADQLRVARKLLDALKGIDTAQLSRAHQVDAQLLQDDLQYRIWKVEHLQAWRWNPLLYTDLAGNSLYLLMSRDFAPPWERLASAAARLEALPRLLAQERESLDPARVPRIHAETALKQNAGVIELIDQLIAPQIHVLSAADQGRLVNALERARTALSQQQIWLEKRLLPDAKGDFRLGAELFDQKLRFELASSLSREQIRSSAEAELARVRHEMYALARRVLAARPGATALPESPTPDQEQTAIAAALDLAAADQPPRDGVYRAVQRAYVTAEQFVRTHDLITLYGDPLEIIPMPQFAQGVSVAFCDTPGPLEKSRKTYYDVAPIPADWTDAQTRSYLREYNTRALHELTIHEAMPGHYVQLAHSNRYASPLRAALQSDTFIEGWAVYAERLMAEQGYLDGDPLMHLVQLKWYLRSIGNAILDQAMHVDGISRDAAMQLMTHDTFQEEREAAAKWVRAQLTATQLSSYFVGVQEHLRLREEARARWGADFNLRRYHDTVLSYGSPPVPDVRALMFDLPIPTD